MMMVMMMLRPSTGSERGFVRIREKASLSVISHDSSGIDWRG